MTLNANLIHVPESGFVFWAPLGSTAPTDYDTALAAAFLDLGYLAAGGLTENSPITTKPITAHQDGEVVHTISRVPQTDVGFGLIEHNKEAVVTTTYPGASISVDKKTVTMADHDGGLQGCLVIVELNANSMGVRSFYPRVKITKRDQIGITVDNEKVFNVGFTAYKQGGFTWKKFYQTALSS